MKTNEIIQNGGGNFIPSSPKVNRSSNLEFDRIVIMLLIIAHHYVVHSGLIECIEQNPLSKDSIFYLLFGAWGKTGINCFVLITGYFMCKSNITLHKFLKLFLWVMTYSVLIAGVFTICGYNPEGLVKMWISVVPLRNITDGFTSCFIVFYLCIPFLNILINNLSKNNHILLIALLLFIYTIHGSIPKMSVYMNYVSWFSVLYLISAYLRIYPLKKDGNVTFWGWMTALSWGVSIFSIFSIQYLQTRLLGHTNVGHSYFFVSDSNSVLALTNGITSFMWFKNLKIKNSKIINTIAASAFGVLLIHANSATMRQWLWNDTINCVGHYNDTWIYPITCVFFIYTVCTIIDFIRVKTIEATLLKKTEHLFRKIKI